MPPAAAAHRPDAADRLDAAADRPEAANGPPDATDRRRTPQAPADAAATPPTLQLQIKVISIYFIVIHMN